MYALFAGSDYYPRGGWRDMVAVAEDMESLMLRITRDAGWRVAGSLASYDEDNEPLAIDWWHIVDTKNNMISRSSEWDTEWDSMVNEGRTKVDPLFAEVCRVERMRMGRVNV